MDKSQTDKWISAWLDGRIDQADSLLLQQELRQSPASRARFRELTHLDAAIRDIAAGDFANTAASTGAATPVSAALGSEWFSQRRFANGWIHWAVAALVLITVGWINYRIGKRDGVSVASTDTPVRNSDDRGVERTIAGHATLRRIAGIDWSSESSVFREGDMIPAGVFAFEKGVAEIDFFCGASVVVEGPAKLELESDWLVRLHQGRLRANVPPAARGFTVKASDSEIIDLGTEFALEVDEDAVRVEVIEGEVKLRGGDHDGELLTTGQSQSLRGDATPTDSLAVVSTIDDVKRRSENENRERFVQWKADSQSHRQDPRLIAYYPIAEQTADRFVLNRAATGSQRDGALVGLVSRTHGRFGADSSGLKFDRPGSRARVLIDGEFDAFTFACWVKIDSLENTYNSLFMSDGYENGEPHWQIRNDGRLMFSVMVDDSRDVRVPSFRDQRIVKDAGIHHVYFTEPFWDVSQQGQWFHLAAVYHPAGRTVDQYVNGRRLSSEPIVEKFHIEKLRIGPAEIGNWGQPFRQTPWFAVRHFNGVIDELSIYNAALNADEIKTMHREGTPFGY